MDEVAWVPFRLEGAPPLIIRYSFQSTSYSVYLSDFTRIWHEIVDRRGIIKRALNEETAIDPSEDNTQLKALLDKIEDALDGKIDTHVKLQGDDLGHQLELTVVASLSGPLGHLSWPIRLQLMSQESFTTSFLVPLMASASANTRQVHGLIQNISEKDHVISKLLDKLESSGIDLTTVFPGAAGANPSKKAACRDQVAKHVKGVAPFDLELFKKEMRRQTIHDGSLGDAVKTIFSQEAMPKAVDTYFSESPAESNWWNRSFARKTNSSPAAREERNKRDSVGDLAMEGVEDNGGFWRQPTPPTVRLQKETSDEVSKESMPLRRGTNGTGPGEEGSMVDDDDESTESEGELDRKPKRTAQVAVAPSRMDNSSVDGVTTKPPSTKSEHVSTSTKTRDGSSPNSSDNEPRRAMPPSQKESNKAGVPKAARLGTIGGRKKDATLVSATKDDDSADGINSVLLPGPPKKAKLGVIGGRRNEVGGTVSLLDKGPSRDSSIAGSVGKRSPSVASSKRSLSEIPAEESEEDRANRRREELKRELDAKVAAPIKKKRRF